MRHFIHAFATTFALLLSGIAAGQGAPPVPAAPQSPDPFMFYRDNPDTSATLFLASVTDEKLTATPLFQSLRLSFNVYAPGTPVCNAAGKLYSMSGSRLVCFDVATRTLVKFDLTTPFVQHDGLLYFITEGVERKLRVVDPASQSYSDRFTLRGLKGGRITYMLLSPDASHIAVVALPNRGTAGAISDWEIGLIDLHNESAMSLVEKLPYTPPTIRTLAMSPRLIAWHDDYTLLTVTNAVPPSGALPENFLTALDINTQKLTRLASFPIAGGGIQFIPPQARSDPLAIVLTPEVVADRSRPPDIRLVWENNRLIEREQPVATIGKFQRMLTDGPHPRASISFNGRIITDGFMASAATISPDGNRLLYAVESQGLPRPPSQLHLFDAGTGHDLALGAVAPNRSFFWVSAKDLTPPTSPPPIPPGFQPLAGTPIEATLPAN